MVSRYQLIGIGLIKKVKVSNKIKKPLIQKNLKVGFAWSGKPTHLRDQVRTMDVSLFGDLFDSKNADFFSLQKFSKKEDLKFLEKYKNVYNCEADLKDFLHTAYLVNEMDVILTIDTSLVHMSEH